MPWVPHRTDRAPGRDENGELEPLTGTSATGIRPGEPSRHNGQDQPAAWQGPPERH